MLTKVIKIDTRTTEEARQIDKTLSLIRIVLTQDIPFLKANKIMVLKGRGTMTFS